MKLTNQSAQYLPQGAGIDGVYKQIELAGRTSYLSWDKMTDYSAKKFVDMLIKSKHTSVLEHCAVYLKMYHEGLFAQIEEKHTGRDYATNPYSKFTEIYDLESLRHGGAGYYISTNLRVLLENGWLDDLKYLCEQTEYHEKRLSVRVVTDIGVTREFNRHRSFSIVEQSTRYCNLSKDKFGNEITFIKPYWYDQFDKKVDVTGRRKDGTSDMFTSRDFEDYLVTSECNYMAALAAGATPQQARAILPLCTKTEAVYTAFESDWMHFFDLRMFGKTGEPHPQIKQLAELIKQEFEKNGVWEDIMSYPSKYENVSRQKDRKMGIVQT